MKTRIEKELYLSYEKEKDSGLEKIFEILQNSPIGLLRENPQIFEYLFYRARRNKYIENLLDETLRSHFISEIEVLACILAFAEYIRENNLNNSEIKRIYKKYKSFKEIKKSCALNIKKPE